jgi:hypothetical protein
MYLKVPSSQPEDCFGRIISNFDNPDNIQSFSNFEEYSPQIYDYDSEDYIPQNEKYMEQALNNIFRDNSNEKTNEDSNYVKDIFEHYENILKNQKPSLDLNHKDIIQQKIREDIYLKRPFKEKKLIGRKRKSDECLGEHNKFSDDNLTRKCKHMVLDSAFNYINQTINNLYSNEDKDILKNKQLFKLGQNQIEKSKVEYNKLFLSKSIEEIFSEDISTKYSRYNPSHNRDIIKSLLNEKDEIKRIIFQNIFKLTFMDCLEHFRGSTFREELAGMNTFEKYCKANNFGNSADEYKDILKIFIHNFEKIVMDKKPRNKKKCKS